MIKRTLYFGNPAYLSLRLKQLVIHKAKGKAEYTELAEPGQFDDIVKTIPIEDIGLVVLDNKQITVTQGLLAALLDNNCAVVTCDDSKMPVGMMLPLAGHTIQNERFRDQLDASLPLRKQLWQQTIQYKIRNQAAMLKQVTGEEARNMLIWADSVRSGDTDNLEGRAAAFYWRNIFPDNPGFVRGGEDSVNAMLNYGYALIRAIVARALVCAGLLPTLGIHHHNRYNAYCLADDIMEPYRPYVDKTVTDIMAELGGAPKELTPWVKQKLLNIPVMEVLIDGIRRPLMLAAAQTATSLQKCFDGNIRKLSYPTMQ